jgi:hypothetical protein
MKPRPALFVIGQGFAIEHAHIERKSGNGRHDGGKSPCPILRVPAPEAYPVPVLPGQHAPAIVFQLVEPTRARGNPIREDRETGLYEPWRGQPIAGRGIWTPLDHTKRNPKFLSGSTTQL